MTLATDRRYSLVEFLTYDDGTNTRYELIDGALIPMSLGTGKHGGITEFINDAFKAEIRRLGRPWISKDMKVGIQSPRGTRWETCRIPDITVLTAELWDEMQEREAVIRLGEAPPLLVVEVVSPSTANVDYRAKHSEYAVLDIPEYWIVDPTQQKVTVCTLVDGRYQDREFRAEEAIVSLAFAELNLMAIQVLEAR